MALSHHLSQCHHCRRRIERETRLFKRRAREEVDPEYDAAPMYTSMVSSLGTVWLAGDVDGLIAVEYAVDEALFVHQVERLGRGDPRYDPLALSEARQQIDEYLGGLRREFDLALDMTHLSPFKTQVFEAVRAIPYGEVRSYGEVAEMIGHPRAGRAVGSAVSGCPFSFVVPCHRVVRAGGAPGTYAPRTLGPCGAAYQAGLIERERHVASPGTWIQ